MAGDGIIVHPTVIVTVMTCIVYIQRPHGAIHGLNVCWLEGATWYMPKGARIALSIVTGVSSVVLVRFILSNNILCCQLPREQDILTYAVLVVSPEYCGSI